MHKPTFTNLLIFMKGGSNTMADIKYLAYILNIYQNPVLS
jgi:hypothetical protein